MNSRVNIRIIVLGLSVALLMSIPIVAYVSTPKVAESTIPYVGFPVHDTIRSYLPDGGTVLAVSETCASCKLRARSFIAAVARRPDHLLLVTTDGGGSLFQDLAQKTPKARGRVVFLSRTQLANFANVKAVPTYFIINNVGRVTDAGPSMVGWLTGILNPRNWIGSWARLRN